MAKQLVPPKKLFEVTDILGRRAHTTKTYWRKIRQTKHRELKYGVSAVKNTLRSPDEIRQSATDITIELYSRELTQSDTRVVVAKILNSEGFAALEILLGLVILAILASGVWVWQNSTTPITAAAKPTRTVEN